MNSTAKHTPGEWRVGDAGHTVFGPKRDLAEGFKHPETIAECRNSANTRHIVKAVNCHDALVSALKALLGIDNPPGAEIGHIDYAQAITQARAALARAEEGEL